MKMAQDFIERFHNLEGTLLKERKKSLFLLLESHKSLYTDNQFLKQINKQLIPKTYLEEIYKLEILIYYRRSSEIFEVLKSCDRITAKKILRQSWFIESLLKDLKVEEFVRNVFPQLSDIVRTKILKQMLKQCKDENYVNALFDSLLQEYGIKYAMILLPGCLVDRIKEILSIVDFRISKAQLKLLHDKDPSLINFYYEEFQGRGGDINHLNDFSKYLCRKDPNLYVDLLFKYKFHSWKLGRRITRKYLIENKENIVKNLQDYLNLNIFKGYITKKQLGVELPTSHKIPFEIPRTGLSLIEMKEKLFRCENTQLRRQFFVYFVSCCSISEDYVALLEILKFTCDTLRNIDGSILYAFLNEIQKVIKLDKLSDEHWKYIHQIMLIQNMRGTCINGSIAFFYTNYLYKNGQEFEKMIPICMKADVLSLRRIKCRNDYFNDTKFEREFLKLALKYYSDVKENLHLSSDIVLAIKGWNKRHPDDVILVSEKKGIIDGIKKCVDGMWLHPTLDAVLSMKYLVCHENMSEEFTDIYFKRLDCLENFTMTKWYLKYRPNVFQENIHKVFECFHTKSMQCLMKLLKKYEHTGLVQIITSYYLEKLGDPNTKTKTKVARLLASIMSKNEYLKVLEKYAPKIDELDENESRSKNRNLHLIQFGLAKSVRFTTCQVDAFPILLRYSKGYYFYPSSISLYSCFNRIPEKSLRIFLDFLLRNPIYVRKHTIFWAAVVLPIENKKGLGPRVYDPLRHDSVKKYLFRNTYEYFINNPLEHYWAILQTYMSFLTLQDTESLLLLTDIHNVPDSYKCVFMEKSCKVFDYLAEKDEKDIEVYYDKLMENIEINDMRLLSSDLCEHIISNKLFNKKFDGKGAGTNFVMKFFKFRSNNGENIKLFSKVLELYKESHWNGEKYEKFAKSVIHSVCRNIFDETMIVTNLPKDFPSILSEEFKKILSIDEFLEEYLMLDFMVLKYQDSKDLISYALQINELFKALRESYGDSIIGSLRDFLSTSLKPLLGEERYDHKLMQLLVEMLERDPSLPNYLLVVQLLPSYRPDEQFLKNYKDVLSKLEATEKIVQLYVNHYSKEEYYNKRF